MLCCVLTETPCVYVAVDNRLTFVCEPFTAISVAIPPEFPWSLTLHPVSMCWTALDQCPAPATRVDVRSVWDSVVGYSSVWGKRSLEVLPVCLTTSYHCADFCLVTKAIICALSDRQILLLLSISFEITSAILTKVQEDCSKSPFVICLFWTFPLW